MTIKYQFLFLFLFPLIVSAQFTEDFSGGSLNPAIWLGDTMNFTVNSGEELQLLDEDPVQTSSRLYAEVSTGDSTNWEFYYRQEFSASSSNFTKVYLAANNSDLSDELNGYFVKLGGITGNADRIELYRQTGNEEVLLISGQDSLLASDPALGRVRVRRDNNNLWTMWVDYSGGTNFILQGTSTDSLDYFGNFFGFDCKYTSTRAEKFFFDDISITPLYVDARPPEGISLVAIDALHLEVLFDEPLDQTTTEIPSNYSLDPSINIISATINPTNDALVNLTLGSPLESLENYELKILGVADKNGNIQNNQTLSFTFYLYEAAEAYDLLINEIYADFTPSIGLPETEYLELYNTSEKIINLQDFILADNTSEYFLPEKLIFPGEYLILSEEGTGDFTPFGDHLPLPDFPTLGNTFDNLVLSNPNGDVIHAVFYDKSWYQNSDKAEGGWSLELINPRAPCTFAENWRASDNPTGGTPGQENSVLSQVPNVNDLNIIRVYPPFGGNQLEIYFNKAVDLAAASDVSNYSINGIGISSAVPQPELYNVVRLQLSDLLQAQTIYTLSINTGMEDCTGAPIAETISINFGLPESYGTGDILINEILFDPYVGGVDFLELYNPTDKIIDLSNLLVANRDDSMEIDRVESIPTNYLLLPDQYVVLTPDPENIKSTYEVENPNAMIAMSLPTFPDDEGTVVLYFTNGSDVTFVDEFSYDEDFHNPLLDNEDGVSLERIFANAPTQDRENWHSAAESAGFATPTYRNSQYGDPLIQNTDLISIPYTTFSPDSDGFKDFLSIQYQTPEAGYLANIKIFDTKGRLIRELSQNDLLGTQGIVQWDGTDFEGKKARIGIYLLWIELFNPNGDVQYFKENCVLASPLN